MKVLVFAGVFDPVHKGHIAVVEKSLSFYQDSYAVIVPENTPQHKHGATSYEHRLKMLTLAFHGYKDVGVIDCPLPEHSVDAFFSWLVQLYPDAEFSWIVGSDVIRHMPQWRGIENLEKYGVVEVLCFMRSDDNIDTSESIYGTPVRYVCDYNYSSLSSSAIRSSVANDDESIPRVVMKYIVENALY